MTKIAIVMLSPVSEIQRTPQMLCYKHDTEGSMLPSLPRHTIEFTTLDELSAKIEALADTFNRTTTSEGCVAWVRINGRKPNGFAKDRRFREPLFTKEATLHGADRFLEVAGLA